MRARAFTCVFTRSCQFTAVFAAAGMVLPLRAMFTAGITRDTSPARCPTACGSAKLLGGIAIKQERSAAKLRAHGDFFVILDSPRNATLSIVVTGEVEGCQSSVQSPLSTIYMPPGHTPQGTSCNGRQLRPRRGRIVKGCCFVMHA